MASAKVKAVDLPKPDDYAHAVATVDVDGEDVTVQFPYYVIDAYGIDDVHLYSCAEALFEKGFTKDAEALLLPLASGGLQFDPNTITVVDSRNWQRRWLDNHGLAPTSGAAPKDAPVADAPVADAPVADAPVDGTTTI
jgi:hypothetical protein